MPPPVGAPVLPGVGPGGSVEAEQRSRRHLKTAAKLARLEQRELQKRRRRARRRRRRLKVVNFFLAIIRGLLAAVAIRIILTAMLAHRIADTSSLAPGGRILVAGAGVSAFFLGIAYLPWPRARVI